MRALPKGEEIQQLCDIVSPRPLGEQWLPGSESGLAVLPNVGIMALFPERGADGCTLFLNHRSLVRNRFGRPNVADELLD